MVDVDKVQKNVYAPCCCFSQAEVGRKEGSGGWYSSTAVVKFRRWKKVAHGAL
jgi:hypothetical protein